MSWADFQEAVVIVAADAIQWIVAATLAAALGVSVLTLVLGQVKRMWG